MEKGKIKLPKDWKWVKFGDTLDIQGGSQPPKSNFIYQPKDGYIQLLQIRDFGERGVPTYVPIKKVTKFCKKDDIMIARYGASLGRIITGLEGAYNVALAKVIDEQNLFEKRYIFYLLKTQIFQTPLKMLSRSAQNGFSKSELAHILLPLPTHQIQKEVVSKIEKLFSELDKGIENLKTAQQQLKTYRQAVLKWAFEGKLTNKNVKEGELPKGWIEDEIINVCDNIKVGIVIKPSNFYSKNANGIKAFRSANVRELQINDSDWVYFTEESNEINYRTKLKEGDVLLVRSGYPGTSCVVSKKFEGSNAIDILIATPNKEKILPQYLCYFNNSPLGKGMFLAKSRGVAQKHLNVGEYSKLKIYIPSIKEQLKIIQEIESRLSVADKMEESITQSLQQAEALRQSILKKAFEGKLI